VGGNIGKAVVYIASSKTEPDLAAAAAKDCERLPIDVRTRDVIADHHATRGVSEASPFSLVRLTERGALQVWPPSCDETKPAYRSQAVPQAGNGIVIVGQG